MPTPADTVTAADVATARRVLAALLDANNRDDPSLTRAVSRVREGLSRHSLSTAVTR